MIFENGDTNKSDKKPRKQISQPLYSGMGKLPPQAVDLEETILGALLLVSVPNNIWNLIKEDFFYVDKHQKIFKALKQLHDQRTPVDLMTVRAELTKNGELEMIGGSYYLTELTSRIASSANIEYHIAIIHEKYLSRELIRVASSMISNCYDDTSNPLAEMGIIITEINQLKNGIFRRTEKRACELVAELRQERERKKDENLIGLTTGKKGVDYVTEGHQGNQLIIKAARPAMGKSADMTSEMVYCCFDPNTFELLKHQIPVACFSLEMSSTSLVNRMLSNISSLPTSLIKKNLLSQGEKILLAEFEDRLSQAEIYIDDTGGLTIDEFEAKAAMLVALYGIKKIYIDYLQLMLGSPGKKYANREAEVSDISRRLKRVAKELDITIIALCQLSREVEKRKFCKPILSDLRESGSIEQDADEVHFLWRPEYYPQVMEDLSKEGSSIDIPLFNLEITDYKGLLIYIVAKCREEQTGQIPLKFDGKIMRVSDHQLVKDFLSNKDIMGEQEIVF